MYKGEGSIYKNTRIAAGFTQEKWAELVGVSVESIRCYENGSRVPPDEVVLTMVDVSGVPTLGLQHLRQRSELGRRYLPVLPANSLLELVVKLNNRVNVLSEEMQALLELAEDGQISEAETPQFARLLEQMEEVTAISTALRLGGFC